MTGPTPLEGLAAKVLAVHELLESMRVPHQFGGAIALAWYRRPRATIDIDLNIGLPPEQAAPVLGALEQLGVTVGPEGRALIERDGQARLLWGSTYLDVFFSTTDFHLELDARQRLVQFGPDVIPIMAPEDLVVCKVVFDRPKDWVDIQAIIDWGTVLDSEAVLRWVDRMLGAESEPFRRIQALLNGAEP